MLIEGGCKAWGFTQRTRKLLEVERMAACRSYRLADWIRAKRTTPSGAPYASEVGRLVKIVGFVTDCRY